jgi:uncharacterized repeat protein (TIGR03803 family)
MHLHSGVTMRSSSATRAFLLGFASLLATGFATGHASTSDKIVYSFNPLGKTDGGCPIGGLVEVGSTLYGAAQTYGAHNDGAVFGVTTAGVETGLYSFAGGGDGNIPAPGLVYAQNTLFGMTIYGGSADEGALYSVTIGAKGSLTESVLHSFGSQTNDGQYPQEPLIYSGNLLYGTTQSGGSKNDGLVFSSSLTGGIQPIYSFESGTRPDDGNNPYTSLIAVGGDFYGTTLYGGKHSGGTIFRVSKSGHEEVIYSFKGGRNGKYPIGGLVDVGGLLYGVTQYGGKYDYGILFSISTEGAFTVLHSFGGTVDGVQDGKEIYGGLTVAGDAIFGTTGNGGANNSGIVFEYVPATPKYYLHYSFGATTTDGTFPQGGPLLLVGDKLYGTACSGGSYGYGAIFEISLPK